MPHFYTDKDKRNTRLRPGHEWISAGKGLWTQELKKPTEAEVFGESSIHQYQSNPPVKAQLVPTNKPSYLTTPRSRGTRDNNNAGRVNDYIDATKDRLEEEGQQLNSGTERKS